MSTHRRGRRRRARRARRSSRPRRRRRARASISCRFGSGGSTIARLLALGGERAGGDRRDRRPTARQRPDRRRAGGSRRRRASAWPRGVGRRGPRDRARRLSRRPFRPQRRRGDRGRARRWLRLPRVRLGVRIGEQASRPRRSPASTRSRACARPSGCRFWRLAVSPRHECPTSCGQARPGIAAIGLFATGGDGERRDTVDQIRLAFGVG